MLSQLSQNGAVYPNYCHQHAGFRSLLFQRNACLVLITSRAVALVCSIGMLARSSFRGTVWTTPPPLPAGASVPAVLPVRAGGRHARAWQWSVTLFRVASWFISLLVVISIVMSARRYFAGWRWKPLWKSRHWKPPFGGNRPGNLVFDNHIGWLLALVTYHRYPVGRYLTGGYQCGYHAFGYQP